jgi:Pro-kumamolisin, activation domain/Bacterial Ig-like domain (group 3)/Putative Ig domain
MLCNVGSFFVRAAFTLVLLAHSSGQAQSPPNPSSSQATAPLDASSLQRLTGNPAPRVARALDRGRVPDALPLNHILLMLRRSVARERELDGFISQQYDPHSANFHNWLTPEQFGERFGPSSADVEKVTQWLTQQGFTVNRIPAGGLFVDFGGDAGKIARAFHTEIHHYRVNGEDHYSNASDPSIPAALSPIVSGFRSLDDFHPRPQVHPPGVARFDRATGQWSRADSDAAHLTQTPGTAPLYIAGPQDFATIYGVNQVWKQHAGAASSTPLLVGTGQTIGVVGESDLQSADIQSFRDQFGITALGPNGSVQMENPPSSVCAAPDPADNEAESYLDAEWAGATAPDATVDFVACGRQGVTSGADLAAAYIIADPAHVQKISVLSTSYGDCEALPQSEANQFYVSLWQQAAVEGITVVVAAGDTGGDGCQSVNIYATDGLSVVNEASTPYNVAAGGTDFSDVFSGTAGTYWSAVNSANFQSALSYIPEMAWNESCASPLVLATFGQSFQSSFGANGFCTSAAQQPVDPNTGFSPYFNPFAGSGGLSTVSARPGWQTGVTGIPAQGGRAVPDISMFASGGYTWSQTLILCDSGLANMPAGTACDFTNANDIFANYSGGTSFVAPAFAGIMALIDQKSGSRQGQANYVLYPLAAQQYVSNSSPAQPSLATCAAYLGTQALSSCYFHDISATPNPAASASAPFLTGTTAVPCTGTATSVGTFTESSTDPTSHNQNCYGYQITVTQTGASLATTPNYYGVLSTAESANAPAFLAGPGYDLATGLGSPNVPALVNAPEWSALTISPSTLPGGKVGSAYSQALTASGRIAPYTWSIVSGSLPPGLSLAASTGVISGTPTAAGPSTFAIQVADSESTPATAVAPFSLTVAAAPVGSATTLTSSALTAGTGMSVTFTATVSGQGGVPTGTVTFLNGSTSIGTGALAGGVATLTTSFATAGTATVQASYGGDANFTASTSAPLTETIIVPGFTATVNPSSLTIPFANSGVVSVTLTQQGGFTGSVNFSCGALPAYFSCSFAEQSAAFTASGAPLTNNLTIHSAAVPAASAAVFGGSPSGTIAAVAFWLAPFFAGLLTSGRRKQRDGFVNRLWTLCLFCTWFAGIAAMSACGRGDHEAPDGTYNVPIILSSTGLTSQTINVTVMVQ